MIQHWSFGTAYCKFVPPACTSISLMIRYLSWTTGYDLLLALSMYRRALTPPVPGSTTQAARPLADQGAEATLPTRTSGYGWSRWWRRGQSAVPASQPPPAPPQAVTTGKESSAEEPAAVSEASSNAVSPSSTAVSPPVTDSAKPIESTTNFAKTLRLSSDQLVSRSDSSQYVSSWGRNNSSYIPDPTPCNSQSPHPTLAKLCAHPGSFCGRVQIR